MADGEDSSSFVEFATARHGALYRYAYLLAGDRGLADDLVQEALTKTYVAWRKLRDPANAEAYTRKAITSIAITWCTGSPGTASGRAATYRSDRPWPRSSTARSAQ